ncbi:MULTISPECIES: enoyl-CoA hydratase-related protein [unclassified Paracoccus (in: a-proteobacteria)]|uniref:enoyl-CoA hydratase/isomerase family protein n=1 Tax=unclassified Paracoccus (in: a-proteobacteria) TaxID=2688777 RepID=UPI00112829E0|nr:MULTISPECIES: enoyl-CoA hydratase-related protein [unclassified Paracoccus (in: a-proteobacteria)]MDF3904294.1 enoyl-CoA hydratase-related protein [Paracoccus sp. AS002]
MPDLPVLPPTVRYERRGAVAIIRIDRPELRNAADRATSYGVHEALCHAEADESVGAIVLTGTGERAFCAGMDLKEAGRMGSGTGLVPGAGFLGVTERRCPKPLIAAVNGAAVAGGCEAALACDLVVAADHAVFGLPEIRRGMVAFAGGVQRLAQILPRQKAFEVIFSGAHYPAQAFAALGLVNRVVPGDRVLDEAVALAEEVLANSWHCLRLAKQLYEVARDETLQAAIDWGHRHGPALMNSADSREGIAAFNHGRDANFANGTRI